MSMAELVEYRLFAADNREREVIELNSLVERLKNDLETCEHKVSTFKKLLITKNEAYGSIGIKEVRKLVILATMASDATDRSDHDLVKESARGLLRELFEGKARPDFIQEDNIWDSIQETIQ